MADKTSEKIQEVRDFLGVTMPNVDVLPPRYMAEVLDRTLFLLEEVAKQVEQLQQGYTAIRP